MSLYRARALAGLAAGCILAVAGCGGSGAGGAYGKKASAVCNAAQKAQAAHPVGASSTASTKLARTRLVSQLQERVKIAQSYLPSLEQLRPPAGQSAAVAQALAATRAQIDATRTAAASLQRGTPIQEVTAIFDSQLKSAIANGNVAWKKLGASGCEGSA
jgi:hypothetical protein